MTVDKSHRKNGLAGLGDRDFSRRALLGAASAALASLGLPRGAFAAGKYEGKRVVFASWGGAYQDAEKAAYCDPFAQKTGATVVQDGPVSVAKFRAMAVSGDALWDVVDVTDAMLFNTAKDGLLE